MSICLHFHPTYSPIPNKLDLTWSRDDQPVCSLTATRRGTAGEALTVGHWRAASVHFGIVFSRRTWDLAEKKNEEREANILPAPVPAERSTRSIRRANPTLVTFSALTSIQRSYLQLLYKSSKLERFISPAGPSSFLQNGLP